MNLLVKGGTDKDLLILDEIHSLEDKIDAEIPSIKEVISRVKGETGEKGKDGSDGKDGKDGEKGKDGKNGLNGKDGKDGRDGKPGRDGNDGKDGRDGRDGGEGKDGSPDTAENIKKKLESLSGDDRIDASAIKNLPKATHTVIESGFRAGAMETPIKDSTGALLSKDASGAWKLPPISQGSGLVAANFVFNEVPSGSGTSFSLANTPTAGTVQLYRGGARQQPGVGKDYTISGANITLAVGLSSGEVLLADYLKP